MKAGRPRYHVPAKWLSVFSSRGTIFYELDSKGNISKGVTEMCMFQPFNLAPNPENKNAKKSRKAKKEKEEDKSATDKQNKQEKEKSKEEEDMTFHIFENELENDYDDDIYHQGENSFDITNFFE